MELNWNFLGEGGCRTKNLSCGEYGYFSGTVQSSSIFLSLVIPF